MDAFPSFNPGIWRELVSTEPLSPTPDHGIDNDDNGNVDIYKAYFSLEKG